MGAGREQLGRRVLFLRDFARLEALCDRRPAAPAPRSATKFDELALESESARQVEEKNGVLRRVRDRFFKVCAPKPAHFDRAKHLVVQVHERPSLSDDFSDPERRLDGDRVYVWKVGD